jgi:WD40 repeat protein
MWRFISVITFLVCLASVDIGVSRGDADGVHFVQAKADPHGDPLPAGALVRMGTLRWRQRDAITYLACTPDGNAVLTASKDAIHLWDRTTGKEIRRFDSKPIEQPNLRQPNAFAALAFGSGTSNVVLSADGKLLAVLLPNNMIRQWDVDTGKELRQIKAPANVNTMVIAPDGKTLALRRFDGATYLLESISGKEIRENKQPVAPLRIVVGGDGGYSGIAFSADSRVLATSEASNDPQKASNFVKFVEVATGKEIRRIEATPYKVTSIAYSPDGKLFAYASGTTITLCEADSGKEIRSIKAYEPTASLTFAPDSKLLAAMARLDHGLHVFETDSGKRIRTLGELGGAGANMLADPSVFLLAGGLSTEKRDFAFTPDSRAIVAGVGQSVRAWTFADGKEQATYAGHRGAVTATVLTPDGKTLISRGADRVIRRWDAATGHELGSFPELQGTVSVAFAPDGAALALSTNNGTILVIATADAKKLHSFKGHPRGAAGLAFSPDSKMLASCSDWDRTVRLFDLVQGTELRQMKMPGANAQANPDVFVFSGAVGNNGGQGLAFSPDGRTIAANLNASQAIRADPGQPTPADTTLLFWDVGTGREIRKFTLPTGRVVNQLVYSPNGRLVATENADQTVSLWEIASGRERAVLGAAAAQANQPGMAGAFVIPVRGSQPSPASTKSLAFSPDGSLLAVRGPSNAVRLWDVVHAKEVETLKGHDGAVQSLAFASNGKTLASGSADTTLLIWDLSRLQTQPQEPIVLQPNERDALWSDLLGYDAPKAARGIQKLAAARETMPFLRDRLKPAAPVDEAILAKWVADLSSDNFATRAKATAELERLGELAVPALKKSLDARPTLESIRRMEPLLEKLTMGNLSADQLRLVRAIEVLERIGDTEARQLLLTLSEGAPGALSTRQARGVLDYLAKSAASGS